jgi:hypothetical protein
MFKVRDVIWATEISWCDMSNRNKDLFSSNRMSEMRPCSVTDHRSGSGWVWRLRKSNGAFSRKLFCRLQLFKSTPTDLGSKPTSPQQRLTCVPKNADGCCYRHDKNIKTLFSINWRCLNQGVRPVAVLLNICSKLPTFYLQIALVFFYWSPNLARPTSFISDALPTFVFLTINLCFGPCLSATCNITYVSRLSEHEILIHCNYM